MNQINPNNNFMFDRCELQQTEDNRITIAKIQYIEERSRWSVLRYADVLGYIPGIAIAIGLIRIIGALFVMAGAGITSLVYKGNTAVEKECHFISQRAEDEMARGGLELGTYGFATYLIDNNTKFKGCTREAINIARDNIFRVDSKGCMHYPREYLGEDGQPLNQTHPTSSVKTSTEKFLDQL